MHSVFFEVYKYCLLLKIYLMVQSLNKIFLAFRCGIHSLYCTDVLNIEAKL